MKLEVVYGYKKEIQPGVQARGGEDSQGSGGELKQVTILDSVSAHSCLRDLHAQA